MGMTKNDEDYDIWFPFTIDLREVCAIRQDDDSGSVVFMKGGHHMYIDSNFETVNQAWKAVIK